MGKRRAPAETGRLPYRRAEQCCVMMLGEGHAVMTLRNCYRGPAVCAESAELPLRVPAHFAFGAAPGQAMMSRHVAHSSWYSV